MKSVKDLTILSSFAYDKLIDESGNLIEKKIGGPAFYLKEVFEKEGIEFDLLLSPITNVEILLTSKGEFGRIPKKLPPKKIDFSIIKTPYVIISTLLGDFDLNNIYQYSGRIFFDVQGYVRDGTSFGRKKYWKPNKELANSIFCLKGTEEETNYLPKDFVNSQKQKLLLITKGEYGCELYFSGIKHNVQTTNVIKTKNTIGAGDTFFAYFVAKFINTNNVADSVNYATENTYEFILNKNL